MSRYIDAEWIRNVYADFEHYENRDDWTTPITNVLTVIDDAPSIDIVFCKECKWFRKAPNTEHDYDNSCGVWASICEEDGFCSYGERREP